jgi:membrane associated rhomboid family serine protease/Zn-finger nucleic acid-binding protein
MFTCPNCGERLARQQTPAGIFWVCPGCNGRAATVSLLRHVVRESTMRDLWARTFNQNLPRHRPCPSCAVPMQEVTLPAAEGALVLDVCRACQFVWFDAREFEAMPALPPEPAPVDRTPPAVRQALAVAEVERIGREQAAAEPDLSDWRNLPAFLGLPVETEPDRFQHFPWLTWTVAALVTLLSLVGFADKDFLSRCAVVPAEFWGSLGLTSLTAFFVHGGVLHLASNLYFLIVFGDNVEDYLGRRRWLLLLAAATFAGDVLHVLADPHATTPCIGASGGIAGLMAFYAFKFPKARLGLRVWMRYAWRAPWVTFPAWGGFAVWTALQCFGILQQLSGFSHVSSLAHVGGAATGILAWALWRNLEARPDQLPAAAPGAAPPVRS